MKNIILFALIFNSTFILASISQASNYIWIEGENPTRQNFQVQGSGWGNKDYLSQESWLNLSIPENEVKGKIPDGGIIFSYDFQVSETGKYEIWNRIGYEFVRSVFQWRIDDDDWEAISPDQLTIDLMDISLWCEVAWLKMGEMSLSAGNHTIQIRHPLTYKDEKPQRILYASDALCIYDGNFRPNGKYRPDDQWQMDVDRQAGENIFQMPDIKSDGERTELPLDGLWEIARFDEPGLVENRTGPIWEIPSEELYWKGISVPGDRNGLRPEMYFCHRYFYRTRINIPSEFRDKSLLLNFAENSMLTTVFVNGKGVAFHDAPYTGFVANITDAVRPGEINEILVGIKDAYYAIEPTADRPNTRYWFNTPSEVMRNQGATMRFDFPMFGHYENGILDTVKLVATGKAYTEDVYVIPSVKNQQIQLEITIKNPADQELIVQIDNQIVPIAGKDVEKKIPERSVKIPPGQSVKVEITEDWKNPHLWWPDDPYQYYAITRLSINGKPVDILKTKFGFREWGIEGTRFALNGVPWQLRANLDYYDAGVNNAENAVEWWNKSGQNMFRFRFQRNWGGMSSKETLDFFDSHGVPVRRTCSTFDGQMASYGLVEFVEEDGKRVKISRKPLFDNWRKQIASRIRQERNHPSVFVWELDNEIIFINTRNLGNLDVVEPEFKEAAKLVQDMDHQGRGVMVAGGRALMDQSLPINGCHYEASPDRNYPDMAYGLGKWTDHNNWTPWPMAKDKPIFLSEEYYANGRKPAAFAGVGGEICFLGRAETKDACGLLAKMYSEGYRWQELGAFQFWFGNYGTAQYNSWQPVMALCRGWNWTFEGGTKINRTIMIRNDTRYSDPIDLEWEFILDGKSVAKERKTYNIQPGHGEMAEIFLDIPEVDDRISGQFLLKCYRGGKEVWQDKEELCVINADSAHKPEISSGKLAVWDPEGSVTERLRQRVIGFTPVDNPEQLPEQFEVLIIGKDALNAVQATDQRWYALAAQGKRIIVLDQKYPLHYQAVPADFEVTDYVGRIAFAENLEHPVFQGLEQDDFFCWSGDHIVYRNVYVKASRGARSLAQCDDELSCSALAECPVNDGLMLLCQMVVGEKLSSDPVAKRLFDNLLNYAVNYKLVKNATAVVMAESDPRSKMMGQSQLEYRIAGDVLAAMQDKNDIVIADATPENLKGLAENRDKLETFAKNGGWLMLWGLTPEGLADFDKIVGFNHVIRPFRREKVELAPIRDPITSGLSQRDVVLLSGERIFGWTRDEYVADDVFTYVVDIDDMAPFMKGSGIEGTASIVNGFTGVEAWKYIVYYNYGENDKATVLDYELPKPETIVGFSIVPNAHYSLIENMRLIFDDDQEISEIIELAEYDRQNNERQDFEIPEKYCKSKLTIELLSWDTSSDKPIVGIDNIWIHVKRSPEFREQVRPLLNIGALVKYPMGKGGIILNQLKIQDREAVAINQQKKQTIFVTLMRNLNGVFSGGRIILPGEDLTYSPVSLEGKCNLYITADRGWPDKDHDLSHLPLDRQKFAGVNYVIRDFKTSPLENGITLSGMPGINAPEAVTGIEVNKKADALFFLHTFYQRREWRARDRRRKEPPVLFQYIIHYADGENETVDVRYGEGAANYVQSDPAGLKDATLAWAAPFPKDKEKYASLYQMQWNNPRPDVEIKSIDITNSDDARQWGGPVILAITTAK